MASLSQPFGGNVAFTTFGGVNTVFAGFGSFATAGAIGQTGQKIVQNGTGIRINP